MRCIYALIICRAMEICVELNLPNAAHFHEKLTDYRLNEDEQAKYVTLFLKKLHMYLHTLYLPNDIIKIKDWFFFDLPPEFALHKRICQANNCSKSTNLLVLFYIYLLPK